MVTRRLFAAAATALGVLCGLPSDGFAQSDAEFRIGWILPRIGPVAELARQYADGVEVTLDLINSSGGFGGLKGRLIVCDSQGQEAQAVVCAKKLINDDNVHLLLGATGTPATVAVNPTVEAAGVPMFAIAAGSVAWVPVKKWIFKSLIGNDDQVPAELEFAKQKNWKRAALIRDNSVFGNDIAAVSKAVAAKTGIEIITDEVYAPTDTDVTAQVTRIRALKPDVILNIGQNFTASSLVSKKIVQLGMKTPIILNTNNVAEQFVKLTPESIPQSYFAALKMVLADLPQTDPLYEAVSKFRNHYKKMRGSLDGMTSNTPQTADCLLFTAAVAKALGPKVTDRNALRDAIERSGPVPGLQGFWHFSPDNHGTDFSAGVRMVQYVNGVWKPAN